MHPFWAVRRICPFDLEVKNAVAKVNAARENRSPPQDLRYNCGFEDVATHFTCSGRVDGNPIFDECRVVFQKIVNTHPIIAGQELLIQVSEPVSPPTEGTDADSLHSPAIRQRIA